jgi:exosortase
MDCWRLLPNKAFFLGLLAAWLVLFQFLGNSILGYIHTPSLFLWMHEAYRSSGDLPNNDAHGNFIPFLVAGLLWWKRKELLALPLKIWRPGLLILVAGMVLHILGYVLQQPRISIVALFAGIYGLTGLAWGREWLRKSFFPFFLFVFSIPLGDQAKFITIPLQLLVSWLTVVSAHIVGIGVMRDGVQLIDPSGTYQYEVAAACSGIRSLIAIFLLATIYGFITFHSTWKRLFLMALAFPFAVLGNLARMLFIIVAAEIGGQAWGNYVHESSLFSLVPYVPAIVGLLLVGRWMEKRQNAGGPDKRELP